MGKPKSNTEMLFVTTFVGCSHMQEIIFMLFERRGNIKWNL